MTEFKVCVDNYRFKSKPGIYEAASIADRIANNIRSYNRDSIKTFVGLVGKEGCTFCPATFKKGKHDFRYIRKSKENFEQTQLFALDFDNKTPDKTVSFEEVKDRAERYDIPILFAYDTFSSVNHDKFRVVLLNDVPVLNRKLAETMLQALHTVFPEADPSCCKDVSRMYYGGRRLLHFDDSIPEISIESLFRNMNIYLEVLTPEVIASRQPE